VLERIALHQTRLRTPGLGLDAKGAALGSKGLVLLASLDRLVAWLSVYTRERSLEDVLPSLAIVVVRSALGTQEIALTFAAESSDRMDRMADTARLVGGFTFTGTSRHFVQYRDAAAPFGYDANQLLTTDAELALYHDKFTQLYNHERIVDIRSLLLRLMPHVDPSTHLDTGSRYILAESGLGPALIHYFVRSQVEADVTVVEWPPESSFDDAPIKRYIFRVPSLPVRMRQLLHHTPGLTVFLPAGAGVAVQVGSRHPVALRACAVFEPAGLALIRAGGLDALTISKLPAWGDVRSFARVEVNLSAEERVARDSTGLTPDLVRVPLKIVPCESSSQNITAAYLSEADLPILRRIAYSLSKATVMETQIAVTRAGVFVQNRNGLEGIPLGVFSVEIHPGLFMPAGYDFLPKVSSEVLYRALDVPRDMTLFILPTGKALAVATTSFASLYTLLLESTPWEEATGEALERSLLETPIELRVEDLGIFPLRDVEEDADGANSG
jgi:hypothetical protein